VRLFGFDITKAKTKPNRFVAGAIPHFNMGKEYVSSQDMHSLLNAYNSWVYVCSSRNAAAFAATPLRLFIAKPEGFNTRKNSTKEIDPKHKKYLMSQGHIAGLPQVVKAADIEEITDHRVLDMLHEVNPVLNKTDLLETTDLYEELTGNAYWYLAREKGGDMLPQEIWPMPPDRVTIVPDPVDFIAHYNFIDGQGHRIPFKREDIIHFKWPNPKDIYYGASPLMGIVDMYNINTNMNRFENRMFSNSAEIKGVFSTEQEIDDDSFERLRTELLEVLQGVANTGIPLVLDKGLKFQATQFSPRELAFKDGRRWTKEEIYEAFDTPMGLFDSKANRANAEAAQFVYAKYGIAPRHRRFEEKLNERLAPLYDEKIFFAFDNVVPEDKEFELKTDVELSKIATIAGNEIRKRRGMEEMEGLDEPFIAQGMVPVSQAQFGFPSGGGQPGQSNEEIVEEIADEISRKLLMEGVGK